MIVPDNQLHRFRAEIVDDKQRAFELKVGNKTIWFAKMFTRPDGAWWVCPIWYAKAKGIV